MIFIADELCVGD